MKQNSKLQAYKALELKIRNCTLCRLSMNRNNPVVGEGNLTPKVVFVGEAPGRWEDLKGRPFVGQAGKNLDKLLEMAGLSRDEVYITNVVKCRPPKNREPKTDEIEACLPYLKEQLNILEPKNIVCLGNYGAKVIFSLANLEYKGITRSRGKIYTGIIEGKRVYILPTFHPASMLYNPRYKTYLEEDFKLLGKLVRGELKPVKAGRGSDITKYLKSTDK